MAVMKLIRIFSSPAPGPGVVHGLRRPDGRGGPRVARAPRGPRRGLGPLRFASGIDGGPPRRQRRRKIGLGA